MDNQPARKVDRFTYELVSRHLPKYLFKDVLLFGQGSHVGWAINYVTVKLNGVDGIMSIYRFSEDGVSEDGSFIIPDSREKLLKILRFHCGEEIINKQLKIGYDNRKII